MDLSNLINNFGDKLYSNGIVAPIIRNPLWVALLITALVLIIIATFSSCEVKYCSKSAFWIFVTTALALTLHSGVITKEIQAGTFVADSRAIVDMVSGPGVGTYPMYGKGEENDFDLDSQYGGGNMADMARLAASKGMDIANNPEFQNAAKGVAVGVIKGDSLQDSLTNQARTEANNRLR
jgi:hypothetical protein